MSSEKKSNDDVTLDDILDQIVADPTIPDEPTITVSLPLDGPDDDLDPILEELLAQGQRDFDESIRRAMQEEMDNVAEARYRTPHKLDVARKLLYELSRDAQVAPDRWLEHLEARHRNIGQVLPVVDGETRVELTDYPTVARATAVIPATVSPRGLVILFKSTELRARNGRRFHKRAWTDVLDLSCATLVHTLPGDVLEHRGSLVWNDGMDRVPLLAGTQHRRS